ncbi:T9SS type A sorting domain-containing protein [Panacibacter ginsenosidivorans]|uniref:T9SS type A sorting domain-containing protein n=1 Tax=Panacibacter ginsenosidivorans TaxID=1813871 RepID=A0A5B8V8L0_9BACT|nr:pre-peptidase C-terminal domain-containing protein [Panacibacter ginsenosidivorans]QEC67046.1 T9SS type A sorting domain-containing protein [Panacibacter ginsenosidivorans]
MKQKFLLMTMAFCALMWSTAKANESEPNNTKAQANTLTLNGSNTGTIGATGDEDWWSVTTTADGKLDVTIAISNGLNMWCQIYDNNGTIVLNSGYTSGTATISKDGLAAGTYYLRVYPYYSGQLPAYSISNTLTVPTQANDAEPNNTKAQAKVLNLNASKTGHIDYYYNNIRDTFDWYKVTTNADGRLRLTMTSANGQNVWAYLYDNDGTTLLGSGYTAGSAVVVNKDGLAAGTYYIRVNTYYNTDWAPYTLADSLFVPTQPNDVEPNNTKALSLTLPLNGSVTGHNNYYYNNVKDTFDWYKVTTNADGRLRLTMTSANGQNVWAYLYDNDGSTVLASGYTSGSAVVVNKDGLSAGTYYVRVNTYYNTEWAPYTLADSLFSPAQTNDVEPNDTKAQAVTLPLNGSKTGHVNYYYNLQKDGQDWYKLTTTEDGMISLTIQSHNGQNVWAYLYDNDGTTQLNAAYTTSSTTIKSDGLSAGTYYIRINTYYTTEFAPYTLSNTLTTYTDANDNEPNNYYAQAKTLPANGTTTGHVNFYYNGLKDAEDRWKINYTGTGALTLNFNQEGHKIDNSTKCTWVQLYKDTTAAPIYNNYFCSTPNVINLSSLTQGYYYVRVFTYYSNEFTAYSLNPVFTQTNVASVTLLNATPVNSCDSLNSIRLQCGGSSAPYKVQLYRFGVLYSTTNINTTSAFTISGLPTGYFTARAYGDGATGNAYSTSTAAILEPIPANLVSANIKSTSAKVGWDGYTGCVLGYKLQYKPQSSATWTTKYLYGTSTNISGLTPATLYQFRVASGDSANGFIALSPYSVVATFTTAASFAAATQSADNVIGKTTLTDNSTLLVYPNPARSSFRIQFNAKTNAQLSATLKDMNGNIVWNKPNTNASALSGTIVDAGKLTGGIYMLQVTDSNGNTIAKKVVVSK